MFCFSTQFGLENVGFPQVLGGPGRFRKVREANRTNLLRRHLVMKPNAEAAQHNMGWIGRTGYACGIQFNSSKLDPLRAKHECHIHMPCGTKIYPHASLPVDLSKRRPGYGSLRLVWVENDMDMWQHLPSKAGPCTHKTLKRSLFCLHQRLLLTRDFASSTAARHLTHSLKGVCGTHCPDLSSIRLEELLSQAGMPKMSKVLQTQ